MTPDGIAITQRVHAAVLVCVKTAAILSAVLALGPLKEEDYMRLVKGALEEKDQQFMRAGCEHSWPCSGKPAVIFHDRGKIFTSERARQVLVDRLGIITEQARRQREDIHPGEVLERLAAVSAKKTASVSLPPAVPDADPDRPVRALPVRTLREEPLP